MRYFQYIMKNIKAQSRSIVDKKVLRIYEIKIGISFRNDGGEDEEYFLFQVVYFI